MLTSCTYQFDSCPNTNYVEQFSDARNYCAKGKAGLAKSLKDWHFAENQVLLEIFPVDEEKGNFVREVRNVLFSSVRPTALQSKIKLAAVSDKVLIELMDMDAEAVSSDNAFLQVISCTFKLLNNVYY